MQNDKEILKNFTILYVEDDIETSEIICSILKMYFKKLYYAPNGEEGLQLYCDKTPDIVLSDIQMPKMNGIELASKIKEIKKDQLIGLLTAFNEIEYLQQSINLGISKYILKPLEEEQFFDALLSMAKILQVELDKKKIEQLLEVQSKVASMGEMIGNIAHQWRQPLSVISTAASSMKFSKEINNSNEEKEMELLDTILDQTIFLSQTISDFQNFFKDDHTQKSLFTIEQTIQKVIKLTADSFKNYFIKTVTNIEDIEIIQNENQLIQALLNIFNNTKDAFMIHNNEERILFIDAKKLNNHIILTLKDSAGGINESIKNKIFDPYFTTKHQYSGTGIGLFMTHQIITKTFKGYIEADNIEYTFENKKLKGALFTITLPVNNIVSDEKKNSSNP